MHQLGHRHYAFVRTRLAANPSADTAPDRLRHIACRNGAVGLKSSGADQHVPIQRQHLQLSIVHLKEVEQLLQLVGRAFSRNLVFQEILRCPDVQGDFTVHTVVVIRPDRQQEYNLNEEKRHKDDKDIVQNNLSAHPLLDHCPWPFHL
ncbi:hypothetical protein D3C75_632820 [compost metagenome]